jgi:hypothetical protein
MSNGTTALMRRTGVWQRGIQSGYVFIISQDWDYYYDDYTDGDPDVGPDGLAYYVLYGSDEDIASASSRSPTCQTEFEAIERAEALVGPIKWSLLGESR